MATGTPAREADDQHEVVRFYTRARKFPQLIGKTPGGERIWGGPYTITQVLVAAGVGFVDWKTAWLGGHFGGVGNLLALAAAIAAAVAITGRTPPGARNPVSLLLGAVRALNAPPDGTLAGRPVRERRPVVFRSHVVVQGPATGVPAATEPAAPPAPRDQAHARSGGRRVAGGGAAVVPMTNLERLLASRKQEG